MTYTALGVYVFAGGFSLGVERHLTVRAHLEDGPYGVATVKLNRPWPIYTDPRTWPLRDYRGVDLVYCNPPCAAWSQAGTRGSGEKDRWRTDARVGCVENCFQVFRELRPAVWLWESVPRALTNGRDMVHRLAGECLTRGYAVTFLLQEASLMGVPQRRRRFMFIAHRVALPWQPLVAKRVTVGEALHGVKPDVILPLSDNFKRVLAAMGDEVGRLRGWWNAHHPESKRKTHRMGDRLVTTGRPHFLAVRLDPDDVAPTMTGGAHWFHWREYRYIAPNESALLCGFPRDYRWDVPRPYNQIAQGVMPPVGAYVASVIAAGLRANREPHRGTLRVDLGLRAPEHEALQEPLQLVEPRGALDVHAPAVEERAAVLARVLVELHALERRVQGLEHGVQLDRAVVGRPGPRRRPLVVGPAHEAGVVGEDRLRPLAPQGLAEVDLVAQPRVVLVP